MYNRTRSHLNLQQRDISDLLYYSPSRKRSSSYSVCQPSGIHSLLQQNLSAAMLTSQSTLELLEEKKNSDSISPSDTKLKLQSFKEQEKIVLQSIKKLTEEEMTHIDQWLSALHNVYEDLKYPTSHRVFQATTYFNDEQQLWYEQTKAEINNDCVPRE
ncbi:unnamed protein product [Rotaria sordida]|uniref:Uncharacterized protein n=1 Tax=Rotaria sordida TaxID=392033 RepID=A0A815NIZ7_9BILA|nr:unnamed protein product [Rotaria sordida]CAF1633483.1 unnamed protein product [Rotaria sordida]